jgi:hypothetical protein
VVTGYKAVRSYRAKMELEAAGTKQEINIEVVAPDKFRMVIPGGLEIIMIGNDTYTKIGTAWTKTSGASGLGFDPNSIGTTIDSVQSANATRGATASVNGKTCQIYTYTAAGASQEMCVADGLPLRVISTSGTSKTTITFSDYNASITINAPI